MTNIMFIVKRLLVRRWEAWVKVTKEKAAEHRNAIVQAAGRLFRERGFDGVGVAEITKAAGLTHGGFYGHFASKDALAAEACGQNFANSLARLPGGEAATTQDLSAYLDNYLSERHRDLPGDGCPMAANASDLARQGEDVQRRSAQGVERFIDGLMERLPAGTPRAQGILMLSAMVGGMTLARATARSAPELSMEILESVRAQLVQLAAPAKRA
ncbi:MAG: transcriptional regulator, TetR family [Xanthobacteraceae bacterium]|nr:transcriptional regulator, TetR family [Xanthobacteraceae bacterium]